MPMESWECAVVATLRQELLAGCGFEYAWILALKRHPPNGRDRRRIDAWQEADLFHQDVEIEPSVVEFLKMHCEAAYLGRLPELSFFSLDGLRDSLDERSGLAVMDDYRQAA